MVPKLYKMPGYIKELENFKSFNRAEIILFHAVYSAQEFVSLKFIIPYVLFSF
jgi:hypothetical protein